MTLQNKSEAKIVKGLQLIEHNVKRISRIIRALLGFAGHNAQESEWEEFDIEQALRQALALVEHQLNKGLIKTSLECEENLPQIIGHIGGEGSLGQFATLLQGQAGNAAGVFSALDKDGDGNPLNDIAGMAGNLFGSKS